MKRNLLILLTVLLLSCSLIGCGGLETAVVQVNVEKEENLHNTVFGKNALIEIGNGLHYDSATRIVYIMMDSGYEGYLSPYYAPNGLPYKYNPETNTFEEIEVR